MEKNKLNKPFTLEEVLKTANYIKEEVNKLNQTKTDLEELRKEGLKVDLELLFNSYDTSFIIDKYKDKTKKEGI